MIAKAALKVPKQTSVENWIPEAVRLQMLRRSLQLAQNQVLETASMHQAVARVSHTVFELSHFPISDAF